MFKKLGIQLYTVRETMKDAESIRATFKALKEMGYDQAQTAGCAIPFAEFGQIAKEEGIEIVGTHESFTPMLTDIEKCIKDHQALGTTNMGIGGMPGEYYESKAKTLEFCEKANKIGAALKPYGMKFTYHNHSGEFKKFPDSGDDTMMDILLKNTDPETVSFVMDTYWIQHGGGDVCDWIEKFAGRIDILHLKDKKVTDWDGEISEIGRGNLPWKKILETAERTGVKTIVVEQDCNWEDGDALKSAKISADYLAQFLDK